MKYTFTTTTTTGEKLYPMTFSEYPIDEPIGKWTMNRRKCIRWDTQDQCETIMSYYGGTELVKIRNRK